ncbi:hypothetical protein D3C81_2272490 [compost metagenome]
MEPVYFEGQPHQRAGICPGAGEAKSDRSLRGQYHTASPGRNSQSEWGAGGCGYRGLFYCRGRSHFSDQG